MHGLQLLALQHNRFTVRSCACLCQPASLRAAVHELPSPACQEHCARLPQGRLPASWGSLEAAGAANSTLETLYLHGNQLTGGLPEAWGQPGAFEALRQLTLGGNPLGGGLPAAWGDTPGALPQLQALNASAAGLAGPLPGWGGGGLQRLQELAFDGNALSGTIPASWAQLPRLRQVVVQPGNAAMCAEAPAGAAFQLCQAGDRISEVSCQAAVPSDASQCGGQPSGNSSSSFPVAAVAVPVAVVGTAALAAAGYVLWRRRRRTMSAQGSAELGSKKGDVQARAPAGPACHLLPSAGLSFATTWLLAWTLCGFTAAACLPPRPPQQDPDSADPDPESVLPPSGDAAPTPNAMAAAAAVWAASDREHPPTPAHHHHPSRSNASSLQQQRSSSLPDSGSLPPPPSGSTLGTGGASSVAPPAFTERELAALQLSDWEIAASGAGLRTHT